jgi:uncharacterized protein (DUF58 family)
LRRLAGGAAGAGVKGPRETTRLLGGRVGKALRERKARTAPEGIRITKVGLWYVLFTVLVAIAATNTGNNALYMVLSAMLAVLAFSGLISRQNVRGLAVSIEPPGEVFARTPARVGFTVAHRARLMPRWSLLFSLGQGGSDPGGPPLLIPYLPRGGASRGEIEVLLPRRGLHRLSAAHVASLFPFGFFRKGVRYRLGAEVLVFPELFAAGARRDEESGEHGDESSRRVGWGHELHSLRGFRQGDDPRSIHWKQSARTGALVYMEREAEDSRRLAILFDNGVGPLANEAAAGRFERLVSEAATAALDHLARGWEVELVTRDRTLPFAAGSRQRWNLLEALALLEPVAPAPGALISSDPRAAEMRLALVEPERRRRAG